ncbi:MAG TPA: cupin domain-containing protein [Acidobacteriota bacterium]|nr:cupin domain-containing protein [Acidobacteriota bacterium]
MEGYVKYKSINFMEKLSQFSDHWSPKIIAQMNDYHFKLVKLQGEFVWHTHSDTDEVFIVLEGALRIDLRDGSVELKPGEMFVVPRGVEHKPHAEKLCKILLIEPAGTQNTGDEYGDRTAPDDVWI